MTAKFFLNQALLPSPDILRAFGDQMMEGLLLFRADGKLILANAIARQSLCKEDPTDDRNLGERISQVLPSDALNQARSKGSWTGSLPVADRVVIAHLYYNEEYGPGHFLALFHNIEGQQDYERELQQRHAELRQAYLRLNGAQDKLLQSEKMASIGQLAAGVAHEINNPIGYVHSNLGSLQEYLRSLFTLIEAYERALQAPDPKALIPEIDEIRNRADIDFISRDLPQLMAESREGIERVTRIVRDLKDFSYSDRSESWKMVDLHAGLESTINIIWNELKYKVTLERNYAELPLVECLPSELNQVYMNMLLNAGQAIVERGTITVTTGRDEAENVWIQFQDSGAGIAPDLLQRIFDPFFTTKPVGSGTGLGLSISYGIINKHHGRIDVESTPGQGASFRITLPVRQPR
ncbi:histidine kinase [Xanthomonas citri pv. fuscans]|uniref:histidine kinase n=2 Tax=Xanthomonas TaxID=338 RepID=A0AB34Q252_XANCI|nr:MULTISPECIES: ATP-binding protein [Xanthomonas]AMV03517.1 histidine kinase [Xanthomonas citri pv. aurantifolii]ASL00975.1 sensor histidine kinase [Xanthomonas citri pv. vignicola]ATB58591.1 putative sensory protein of a two component system [Xanthomonas citri pv. fuscans]ATS63653.1 sensor histidine kinase [Xanthomonas citri pv. phaseoli var. fuscans]ATS68901.1 sensor histidine kinase [Xanthomonas citri pv. phaseoli var. fuscans]